MITPERLYILVIEADRKLRAQVRDLLLAASPRLPVEIEHVETAEQGLQRLSQGVDACIIDLGPHAVSALLESTHKAGLQVPLIVLADGGTPACGSGEAGAVEYLDKSSLTADSLRLAIRHAVDCTQTRSLQQQLLQAQKMEAIGKLAGGIAHDFNNLLMVISSYSEVLLHHLTGKNRHRASQIVDAAQRAASLTRQLLAFSRPQVVARQPIDLNGVVRDLGRMLPRLIGENIEVELRLAPGLHEPLVDPAQMQQVIMNLAVNARDAMPTGGRLIIETADVEFQPDSIGRNTPVPPGQYVMLAVSDTGCGIEASVLPHIFEPFFTTKEPGSGTGLGLSTVSGIVQQSGGHTLVHSEPGHGATFRIYLPRAEACRQAPSAPAEQDREPGGTETILLVEDEGALREVLAEYLQARGYTVLAAHDGEQALQLAADFSGPIHLLVTDVVMPRLGGPEVQQQLHSRHPATRVLYVSGYTESTVVQDGIANRPAELLQKPFGFRTLAQRVRDVLDQDKTVAAPPATLVTAANTV